MTQDELERMTDAQLREYVRYHPEDEETFHFYMDRLQTRPAVECNTPEEIEAELRRRVENERRSR